MEPRLIAIGDVHGCSAALTALLRAVRPKPHDQLVLLGDYIDRGPDSCAVIDQLLKLRGSCQLVTLLGNHEEMMLRVIQGEAPLNWWLQHGGVETLDSYGCDQPSQAPEKHLAFLEQCEPYFETDEFFFVHANYVAGEPLDRQPAEALRWQSLSEHFPEAHCSGKTAIMGHSAQHDGDVFDAGYLRCLDTYCVGGGWLTAMEVRTGQTWQADRLGRLRDDD